MQLIKDYDIFEIKTNINLIKLVFFLGIVYKIKKVLYTCPK